MNKFVIMASVLVLGTVMLAGRLSAQQSLRDVSYVTEGLIAVGMALEISEQCDSLSPRLLTGYSYLNQLKSHAKGLGFSDDQIDAFTNDRAEKTRLEAVARNRLEGLGVVAGQADSYCQVGRAQIAAGTTVGQLLR